MNGEKASLRERERLQQQVVADAITGRQAGLNIKAVLAGKLRDAEEVGWCVQANGDVGPPPTCELRHKIAAYPAMKFEKKSVIESALCELAVLDPSFQRKNIVR